MAQVMAVLIRVADQWSAMTDTGQPAAVIGPDRKLELLGVLVQLFARRTHAFREVPSPEDLSAELRDGAIQLRLRSRGRVPIETDVVERQLSRFGFVVERVPGTEGRELVVAWSREPCATVIELPRARAALQRKKRTGR
jgi:hypothetical protein